MGVTNHVVVPQRWDEQNKRVKTDARDARELCDRLDRYVRGNTTAFSIVRVPTPEQEQRRALGRQRDTLVRERQRCVVRGHGLMLAQGVRAPEDWWKPKVWDQFRQDLPEWLRTQILVWQEAALRLEAEVEQWTHQVRRPAHSQRRRRIDPCAARRGGARLAALQEPAPSGQLHRAVSERTFLGRATAPRRYH
jgi:transposase